nr:MAG: hypothetical protein DIU52_10720 [bacterium]
MLGGIAVGLLWLGCARAEAPPALVIFDESLGEPFSIRDAGFKGYSLAAEAMRNAGYRVAANWRPLHDLLPAIPEPSRTVVVVAVPSRSATAETRRAAAAFLNAGGRMLLLAEHDDIYGNASIVNELLSDTGVEIGKGRLAGAKGTAFSPGPVSVGRSVPLQLDSVILYLAAPFARIGERTVILLEGDAGTPLVLGASAGRGRLAVAGDAEFIWNGTPGYGIRSGRNEEFLLGLVRWLLRHTRRAANAVPPRAPGGEPGDVVAVTDRHRHHYGHTPDGYAALLDALAARGLKVTVTDDSAAIANAGTLIIADPAPTLPAGVREAQRIVFLLGAASGPPVRTNDLLPARHPVAQLLAAGGIEWLHGIVDGPFDESQQPMPETCRWRRAALLRLFEERPSTQVHAWTRTAANRYVLPWVNAHGEILDGPVPPFHAEGWPMVISTARHFVIASGSVLANVEAGNECFAALTDQIASWIQLGKTGDGSRPSLKP